MRRCGVIEAAFVTGSTGFLGRALVARLRDEGVPVVGFSRRGGPVPGEVAGDVCRLSEVEHALRSAQPSHVFHLAALKERRATVDSLPKALERNAIGTTNVLLAALRADCRRVVVVGTAEEYGPIDAPFRESDAERPTSVYGVSKLAATRASLAFEAATSLEVVVMRPGVAYGPGQPRDMFLGALLDALLRGRRFAMTTGEQTRDFVFVDDVVAGLVSAARAPGVSGRVLNLGSGRPVRVRDAAELSQELVGVTGLLEVGRVPLRAGEALDYWLDPTTTRELTGFRASVELADGLARTIRTLRQ